ncbi:MAG: 16S rRNA (adenine(1518)-N(6)/adenine(1519)-N(6))-dimethyltransferase [Pseudomonadaceae bacterium]|nr:16S rRNA (adenine(1518)-N(6)/adenine(1519)-N(6))-dimethyltransferase [Pseudomonadaceae bacterium]
MTSVSPAKHLGQHFLTNPRTIARIADAVGGTAGQTVAEIGPGTGALTAELLRRGLHVLAVEMDDRCYPTLEDLSAQHDNRLTLIKGDALKLDTWLPHLPPGSPICGNLPYNVGTEITTRLLLAPYQPPTAEGRHPRAGGDPRYTAAQRSMSHPMVFMLQKEVIQRLTATGPSPHWGRLGVITHLLCEARRLFDVPPGCFNPPPKVMSSIVQLTPLPAPRYEVDFAKLDTLLRHAFGQRRKMLRSSLKTLLSEDQITACGIPATARPEELSTQELCNLSNAIK